tara:strand:- start:4482 stop:4931 length:450 start_codon:yes stop_codon:yes gene_type:complete
MKYNIRITLESKEDVIREIEINSDCFMSELHYFIIDAFGLDNKELASFYTVNSELELEDEFPLISFQDNSSNMENTKLESVLTNVNDKLIYVFDYMKMWRFLIDLIKIETDFKERKCTLKIGKIPDEAPEVIFNQDDNDNFHDDKDEYY